jgi:hypothetical protein
MTSLRSLYDRLLGYYRLLCICIAGLLNTLGGTACAWLDTNSKPPVTPTNHTPQQPVTDPQQRLAPAASRQGTLAPYQQGLHQPR